MRIRSWLRVVVPALALAALAGLPADAVDVLETRDGRLIEGTYRGGTQSSLRFETDGAVQVVPLANVLALTFGARTLSSAPSPTAPSASGAAAAAASRAAPAPPAPETAKRAVIPAGMHLQIRIAERVDAGKAAIGDRFDGVLESSLMAGDTPIVPPGTPVQGRVAEIRSSGPEESRLKLELDGMLFRDEPVALVTGTHRVAALPPAAAAVAVAEAGEPATDRAAVPAGTLLEFRLLQPVELRLR